MSLKVLISEKFKYIIEVRFMIQLYVEMIDRREENGTENHA